MPRDGARSPPPLGSAEIPTCSFLPRLPAATRLQPPEEQGRALRGWVFIFYYFFFNFFMGSCTPALMDALHRGEGTPQKLGGADEAPRVWDERNRLRFHQDVPVPSKVGTTEGWGTGEHPGANRGSGVSPKPGFGSWDFGVSPKPSLRAPGKQPPSPGAPDRGGHSPSLAPSHLTATSG